MDLERKESLYQLAQLMSKQSLNLFPITGKTLQLFDLVITEQEVEFLLKVGRKSNTEGQLRWISGLDAEAFQSFFQAILRKGLLLLHEDEGRRRTYSLAAIVVGWVEFTLIEGRGDALEVAFARKLEEFFQSFTKLNQFPKRQLLNLLGPKLLRPTIDIQATVPADPQQSQRTIQLDLSVPAPEHHVHPSNTVFSLLSRCGERQPIALVNCFCRQWRNLLGEKCRFHLPNEACLVVGHFSRQLIEQGLGRAISRDQARHLVQITQKRGAVHAVFHDGEDLERPEAVICNCCWDCCGFLGNYNRARQSICYRSHYLAVPARPKECQGCGRCEKICPSQAIQVRERTVSLRAERCIGCGQCAFQCKRKVYELVPSTRSVFLPMLKAEKARLSSSTPQAN